MNNRLIYLLSSMFIAIPLLGELSLYLDKGFVQPTIFPAILIAGVISANLIALRFHQKMHIAKFVLSAIIALGGAIAVVLDGGLNSTLWIFLLVVICGVGAAFGQRGSLVLGGAVLLLIGALTASIPPPIPGARVTVIFLSTLAATIMSFLYEREKSRVIKQNQALVATQKGLVEANDELRQFAYRTSHDLRSPLYSIRGIASMIQEDVADGDLEEAQENAKRVVERADTLVKLVNDIQDLMRADLNESAQEVELEHLVHQIFERLSEPDWSEKIRVDTSFEHTATISCSRTRLSQILSNLISNAVRYRDPAKDSYLTIKSVDCPDGIEISLADNGLGIDPVYADRMFKMFQRFHPSHAAGSGLGLYIVHKHVEKMNGTIRYRRTEVGSVFTLTLSTRGFL